MKPVHQRIICEGRGDCMSACLASVLELSLDDVPAFCAIAVDSGCQYPMHEADQHMRRWLRDRGFHGLRISYEACSDWRSLEGAFAIATMPSQRFKDGWHAVVVQWQATSEHALRCAIVHDPNPGNAPYPDAAEPKWLTFLVPISPAVRA